MPVKKESKATQTAIVNAAHPIVDEVARPEDT